MTVELTDFTVRYRQFTAVNAVTVSFPSGGVGLLGRNGAGKSTILKTILGLVRSASGSARVLGVDALKEPRSVRALVGYLPEKECWFPHLTGFEMVALCGELSGLPQSHARQRAHESLFYVDLGEQRYRPVATYSTGMKQKVKLAAALVHDPQLLFLDEPTNGLDPAGRVEMLDLIRDLVTARSKSVILSSHILGDVERVCTSAVLLEKGQVRAAGRLDDLTKSTRRAFRVRVEGDLDAFSARLRARGLEVRTLEVDTIEALIPEGLEPAAVFADAVATGAVVRGLVPTRRTLEDVFVDAIAGAGMPAAPVETR